MADYHIKRPGDILHLASNIESAMAGYYVLMSSYTDPVSLCCVEESDDEDIAVVIVLILVPMADLSFFEPTGMNADLPPDLVRDAMPGDIMDRINAAAPVPIGLYQIVSIENQQVLLSRLHSNEDGKLATTGRTPLIRRDDLVYFRRMNILDELRP